MKYATKDLNSSVSVFLDLTEPKRNEITEIPKFTKIVLFRSSTVIVCIPTYLPTPTTYGLTMMGMMKEGTGGEGRKEGRKEGCLTD